MFPYNNPAVLTDPQANTANGRNSDCFITHRLDDTSVSRVACHCHHSKKFWFPLLYSESLVLYLPVWSKDHISFWQRKHPLWLDISKLFNLSNMLMGPQERQRRVSFKASIERTICLQSVRFCNIKLNGPLRFNTSFILSNCFTDLRQKKKRKKVRPW